MNKITDKKEQKKRNAIVKKACKDAGVTTKYFPTEGEDNIQELVNKALNNAGFPPLAVGTIRNIVKYGHSSSRKEVIMEPEPKGVTLRFKEITVTVYGDFDIHMNGDQIEFSGSGEVCLE